MSIPDGELETAAEMGRALRSGSVGSVELVERAMARAEAWQPVTNAFSQLWPDRALEEARAVDRGRRGGEGPFAGVPVAVKDLFDVQGTETTGCCAAYRGRIAERNAPVIEWIRRAGIVMIGKTNQHELAAGGTNAVSACGAARNPWDPARMTGGSSGGSAAAVAAGVVPWALGSDTGGSIRIPSSFCGLFGLKPTTGRLTIEGMLPLAPSLDCPGPIASTSMDTRLLWRTLLAEGRPMEAYLPHSAARPEYRIGVPAGFFADRVHPEVLDATERAAEVLGEAGVEIEPVDGQGIEDARRVWMAVTCPEFVRAHPAIRRDLVDPSVLEWIEYGERMGEEERDAAARRREEIGRWFRERLEGFDALLIPTTPYPAPRLDQEAVDLGPGGTVRVAHVGPGWITCSVNLAGLPALNVPAGRSGDGMPIGVTLVGHEDQEERLLGVAAWWERATGFAPSHARAHAGGPGGSDGPSGL